MVSDFFAAGYIAEGAFLASEINKELERYRLPVRYAAIPAGKNEFPTFVFRLRRECFQQPVSGHRALRLLQDDDLSDKSGEYERGANSEFRYFAASSLKKYL